MKKVIVLCLIVSLITGSCTQKSKSSIEGAWQMVYTKHSSMDETFPAQIQGKQIKMFSKDYFAFVGQFKLDTLVVDNFGYGTYKLSGDKFESNLIIHSINISNGTIKKMLIEITNDTLIQKWPADENWKLAEKYNIEKYIRLK